VLHNLTVIIIVWAIYLFRFFCLIRFLWSFRLSELLLKFSNALICLLKFLFEWDLLRLVHSINYFAESIIIVLIKNVLLFTYSRFAVSFLFSVLVRRLRNIKIIREFFSEIPCRLNLVKVFNFVIWKVQLLHFRLFNRLSRLRKPSFELTDLCCQVIYLILMILVIHLACLISLLDILIHLSHFVLLLRHSSISTLKLCF